jgi:hypothetical protein
MLETIMGFFLRVVDPDDAYAFGSADWPGPAAPRRCPRRVGGVAEIAGLRDLAVGHEVRLLLGDVLERLLVTFESSSRTWSRGGA